MKTGYTNVYQFPWGYYGWVKLYPGAKTKKETGPGIGDEFPNRNFAILQRKTDNPYLGLSEEKKSFNMTSASSQYLLLEVYHEGCTICLDQCKTYNQVYRLLEKDKHLQGKVKIIGLGMAGSYRGVIKYKKEHNLGFPLFADKDMSIFHALGSPVLPAVYLLEKQDDRMIIRFKMIGHEGGAEDLLEMVRGEILR